MISQDSSKLQEELDAYGIMRSVAQANVEVEPDKKLLVKREGNTFYAKFGSCDESGYTPAMVATDGEFDVLSSQSCKKLFGALDANGIRQMLRKIVEKA